MQDLLSGAHAFEVVIDRQKKHCLWCENMTLGGLSKGILANFHGLRIKVPKWHAIEYTENLSLFKTIF